MHTEALTGSAKALLPPFKNLQGFYLAGGTALALQLGHRISVDFDFFSEKEVPVDLLKLVEQFFVGMGSQHVLVNNKDELTLTINETKTTFLYYPFPLLYPLVEWDVIKLASIQEIAAMKAYTIGRRGTFKDYIDLYYILKFGITINNIIKDAEKKYKDAFNARLFLEQLVYLDDITDTEIIFLKSPVSKEQVGDFFEAKVKQIKLS